MLDIARVQDHLDDRLGEPAPALPVRERALLVGFEQANIMAGLLGRKRETYGERAFSAAAFLGGKDDRVHCR